MSETEKATEVSDIAREYAELCESLMGASSERGDQFLSKRFDVDPWSAEFFEILFCITARADELALVIDRLSLDLEIKREAKSHISQTKRAFSFGSIASPWNSGGAGGLEFLRREHTQPIKMLSGQVRLLAPTPRLSDDQRNAVISDVEELLTWLNKQQLKDNDFIRQALIDGLMRFNFRLIRLKWVGFGYVLHGLREIIGAYLALERGIPADGSAPDAQAVLKKVSTLIKDVVTKLTILKDAHEVADWALRAYVAAQLAIQVGGVAGFITGPK